MSDERSFELYGTHQEVSQKFDYFVLGATGAVCAYILQTFRPQRIAMSPNTLELVAVLLLVASVFAGFRRIESTVSIARGNHDLAKLTEERDALWEASQGGQTAVRRQGSGEIESAEQARTRMQQLTISRAALREVMDETTVPRAKFWYQTRNRLIAAGVLTLIAARIWAAYV